MAGDRHGISGYGSHTLADFASITERRVKMDNLLEQIKDFKKCVKSDNSDYLTGYIAALSAVEGMIEARRMNMIDNEVRLIDANLVIQKLKSYYNKLSPSIYSEIIRRDEVSSCIAGLINAPTVEAQTVKHGRWIKGHCGVDEYIKCSVCRTRIVNTIVSLEGDAAEDYFDLCPKCGARMDGDGK